MYYNAQGLGYVRVYKFEEKCYPVINSADVKHPWTYLKLALYLRTANSQANLTSPWVEKNIEYT